MLRVFPSCSPASSKLNTSPAAMSFAENLADLPRTAIHHLSPRPAPCAFLTHYHNCQPSSSSSSSLPLTKWRLRCSVVTTTITLGRAVKTRSAYPPRLAAVAGLDLTCCPAFAATAASPIDDWMGELARLMVYALVASGCPPRQPASHLLTLRGFLSYSYECQHIPAG